MPKQSLIQVDRVYRHCLTVIESSPKVSLPLESEWTFAARFNVSRRVARQALQQLVREGRAICHAGKGYASRPAADPGKTKRLKVGIVHHPPRRVYAGVRHSVLTQLCQSLEAHEFTSGAIPIETPETGLLTQRWVSNPVSGVSMGMAPEVNSCASSDWHNWVKTEWRTPAYTRRGG